MFDDADFDANYLCCACGGGTFAGDGEYDAPAEGVARQVGRPIRGDHIVTTTGAVEVDGDTGDDTLEDHDAEVFFIGNAGSDTLISRNGKDALWGGNAFGIQGCTDTAYTDSAGNGCDWYETNGAANCGTFDVLSPVGSEMYADIGCCICGGGSSAGGFTSIAALNGASDINPGTTIGD